MSTTPGPHKNPERAIFYIFFLLCQPGPPPPGFPRARFISPSSQPTTGLAITLWFALPARADNRCVSPSRLGHVLVFPVRSVQRLVSYPPAYPLFTNSASNGSVQNGVTPRVLSDPSSVPSLEASEAYVAVWSHVCISIPPLLPSSAM